EGSPRPLPAAVELSAFRIVQEALTNSLKHAAAEQERVRIRYGDKLEPDVRHDGAAAVRNAGGTAGSRLIGMRDRVARLRGGPDAAAAHKLDPETFFGMIGRVVEQHPNIRLVATTLRDVHSTNRHDWAAVLWIDGRRFVSPTCPLDVLDRIGGGDGFASGLIY